MERIRVVCPDGVGLVATRFEPAGAARAVVVIPTAMGVRQDYYFPFAQYLAEQGFAALTFDFRGSGFSAPRSLRGFDATLSDWASKDYNSVLHEAKRWQPTLSVLVVGHSLGGQLPGLVPDSHLIDGLVTVACGSGYWRENARPLKRRVWWFWYFAVPIYTALWGYFPGKRFRKVGDLPKGVIMQWSRWCRDPDYCVGAEGHAAREAFGRVRFPIVSVSFTDDEMMSARNTESLHGLYQNAPQSVQRITPQEIGVSRIGHFGFFRQTFRESLWQDAVRWLDGFLPERANPISGQS